MDGLDAIYQGHGQTFRGSRDDFYLSAVENSLAFFEEQKTAVTYFLIARDLDDPVKREAIQHIVDAGHRVACHGLRHLYLNRISAHEKREEIFSSKRKIEDALGLACEGFRAPGYSIDWDSLQLLRDAGYRYDSSIFPNQTSKERLGMQRLFAEPFMVFPEDRFFEVPMPFVGPLLPPFHPCYSFYLSGFYFQLNLNAFKRHHNYLTVLFHLTDFASKQKINQSFKLNIFTNNFYSRKTKLSFLKQLLGQVRRDFSLTTTEEFLARWPESAPDLNPQTILGISTTHETGACLVKSGQILAAINEERLTRRKLDSTYPPVKSIREVIRISGVAPKQIDAVAIAGLHWKDLISRTLESIWADVKDFHAWNDYFPHFCRLLYRLFYFSRATRYRKVLTFLEQEFGISPKVYFIEHHEAHAASVYRTGHAKTALLVTADGVGDDLSITFSRGERSVIHRLQAFHYPNSFGQFYTACTQILGFKAGRHEGKITGLSGYGKPDKHLLAAVQQTIFSSDGFKLNKHYYSEGFMRPRRSTLRALRRGVPLAFSMEYRNYKKPLKQLLQGYSREDIAYAFQYLLEREMVRLSEMHVNDKPVHLGMAGGVFANVKLNMALSKSVLPKSVFIFPNMGDGGLSVGAALSVNADPPTPVKTMYLGTEYTEKKVLNALEQFPTLTFSRSKVMARTVARELANKRIVARFDGRMEFGPRALGNRSILYHCGDQSVNDWLNRQLKRTEFMPFAPICIYEDAEEYFVLREGEKRACEFMTLVVMCTDKMIQTCPAAVHVDGTARPQLLQRSVNPEMYDILTAYKELTGISCLINTSFNMHEEPIVRSPEEAIIAFQKSRLDLLILGPFLINQPGQSASFPETHKSLFEKPEIELQAAV